MMNLRIYCGKKNTKKLRKKSKKTINGLKKRRSLGKMEVRLVHFVDMYVI